MKSPRIMRVSLIVMSVMIVGWVLPTQAQSDRSTGPIVSESVRHSTSVPLRDIVREPRPPFEGEGRDINPLGRMPKVSRSGLSMGSERMPPPYPPDPAPVPLMSFNGIGNTGWAPPDTVGDVGPNHYVQAVNTDYAVFNKATGALVLGPFNVNDIWTGAGGKCESQNDGDPIILYDSTNDRWMISQFYIFGFGPNTEHGECIAVSTTGDPTGSWHRYEFFWSEDILNDYPHFGIWPDGLYMAANQFDMSAGGTWAGQGVAAFEWEEMLKGNAATMVKFDLFTTNADYGAQIPADWDGAASPPPAGRPGLFIEWEDKDWYNPALPTDQLWVWEFHVDWDNPGNSTFGNNLDYDYTLATIDVDPEFCNYERECIPQPPYDNPPFGLQDSPLLEPVAPRLMHRLAYRNMGSHEVIVGSHTVDADGTDRAGIHWFELRDPFGTPFMQQDSVFDPDDGENRWMGSIAMDKNGNIALGYSVSSLTTHPSVRYTGRLATDPLGTMRAEQEAFDGAGSQTGTSRWGDYSSMNVDPVDDLTFWYTQEYYETTSSRAWDTGIVSFAFDAAEVIFSDGFESGDSTSWSSTTP